jgi:hypothetical protein
MLAVFEVVNNNFIENYILIENQFNRSRVETDILDLKGILDEFQGTISDDASVFPEGEGMSDNVCEVVKCCHGGILV